uniref:Secreted protein n=1 Tax=Ixodes ricinus TaxID=34613 RepID=A0A6B0V345_IXORI
MTARHLVVTSTARLVIFLGFSSGDGTWSMARSSSVEIRRSQCTLSCCLTRDLAGKDNALAVSMRGGKRSSPRRRSVPALEGPRGKGMPGRHLADAGLGSVLLCTTSFFDAVHEWDDWDISSWKRSNGSVGNLWLLPGTGLRDVVLPARAILWGVRVSAALASPPGSCLTKLRRLDDISISASVLHFHSSSLCRLAMTEFFSFSSAWCCQS